MSANAGRAAVALNAKASASFDAKLAASSALLQQAVADIGATQLTQASSLGAEDVVITHLINRLALGIPVFVLDTGKLHAETLQLLEQTKQTSLAPVIVFYPKSDAVTDFTDREGETPMYKSIALRKACCELRKMEPLARALAGKKAWITGLRREQSGARADVPLIDTGDTSDNSRVKLNPLADWTWGDVWHYIQQHEVAYNPLHDQFYPSIGCAPCTRAISQGEDFRAGRWWWESSELKECGLHVRSQTGASTSSAAWANADFAPGEVKASPEAGCSQSSELKECGLHVKTTNETQGLAA